MRIHRTIALAAFVALSVPKAPVAFAVTAYPYECGNVLDPTSSGIVTSDALTVLRIGVGQDLPGSPCELCYCDANRSGHISTTDALLVLRRAVGSESELTCYSDIVNHPEEPCTPCHGLDKPGSPTTTHEIRARLSGRIGTNTNVLGSGSSILWQCKQNTTVNLINNGWTATDTTFPGAGAVISEAGVTVSDTQWSSDWNLTFRPVTLCYSSTSCPNNDGSGLRFLKIKADNVTVDGFHVQGFFEGIHFEKKNGTVQNVDLDRQCDDSITNLATGLGNEVRDSTIQKGCDKCVQDEAGPSINTATCSGRECYHIAYHDVDFLGCKQVFRNNSGTNGRFWLNRATVMPLSGFPCVDGINVGSPGVHLEVSELVMDNCQKGVQMAGAVSSTGLAPKLLLDESIIDYSDSATSDVNRVGVDVFSSAKAELRENVITRHGKCCGLGTVQRGGAAVSGSATLDIVGAGGTGGVGNKICHNTTSAVSGSLPREIDNNRSGYTVPAQSNWWCNGPGGLAKGHVGLLDDANALVNDPFPNIPAPGL